MKKWWVLFLSCGLLATFCVVAGGLSVHGQDNGKDIQETNVHEPKTKVPGKNTTQTSEPPVAAEGLDYRLGVGDQIEIRVYGEPDMSMTLKINKRGTVNFPYIGSIQLSGCTPTEVGAEIAQRLQGDYLLNPMVTVNIEHFRKFYIMGEVEAPNGYEYQPGLTVEQAIALAGGLTDRADQDDIDIRLPNQQLIESVALTHLVGPDETVIIAQSFF